MYYFIHLNWVRTVKEKWIFKNWQQKLDVNVADDSKNISRFTEMSKPKNDKTNMNFPSLSREIPRVFITSEEDDSPTPTTLMERYILFICLNLLVLLLEWIKDGLIINMKTAQA